MKTEYLDLRNMDCMELMAEFPNKHFDLAIVDPPYGIGEGKKSGNRTKYRKGDSRWRGRGCTDYLEKNWDDSAPNLSYFDELRRVSKNQICWGANHYIDRIPYASPCWVVWDKMNGESDFADCELAWTSMESAVRKFGFLWSGMRQGDMKNKESRIHPTQKPVKLYSWLLSKYAKPGQKILDTHMGSGSIAIACHYAQCHLTASEMDKDYFIAACERIERETRQQMLFA